MKNHKQSQAPWHSPAPWKKRPGVRITDANGDPVADVLLPDGMSDKEFLANRSLINAAPIMLAACKDAKATIEALCSESEHDDLVNQAPFVLETLNKLNDAIAKAEAE